MAFSYSLRAFAKKMYSDSADVYRSSTVTLQNGSKVQRFSLIIEKLPCRLSRVASRRDSIRDLTPLTEIDAEACLFCEPDTEIHPGDRISVFRLNSQEHQFDYVAGEAFIYSSHIEIPLMRSIDA